MYVCLLAERHGGQFIMYSMGGVSASSAERNGFDGGHVAAATSKNGGGCLAGASGGHRRMRY